MHTGGIILKRNPTVKKFRIGELYRVKKEYANQAPSCWGKGKIGMYLGGDKTGTYNPVHHIFFIDGEHQVADSSFFQMLEIAQ